MKVLKKILVYWLAVWMLSLSSVAFAAPMPEGFSGKTDYASDTAAANESLAQKSDSSSPAAKTELDADATESGYKAGEVPVTLIPKAELSQQGCFNLLYKLNLDDEHNLENLTKADVKKAVDGQKTTDGADYLGEQVTASEVLGCAIKTGLFRVWMLPLLVKYLIDFALGIAGLVAVLFLVVGGYIYMFSGLSDDKERGKKAILYGILGFAVALLAWVIVNAVQLLVTS